MINMEIGVSFLPKIAINSGILDKYPMLIIDKNQACVEPKLSHLQKSWIEQCLLFPQTERQK
jgi:hypothetical protein